jgi:dTDP-4-dehydrorhamnose reductase
MSRVLVAGAQGMLGCTLVPHLRAAGYDVICHARNGESGVCFDLAEPAQIRTMLDRTKPDVIVNLAALTNVDECERNPNQSYLANVRIVENLTSWIRDAGTHAYLVQLSTDQVYDGVGPHKEDGVALTNYYAFSKYAGELAAAAVPSTVLRTNFFGPSQCAGRKSLSDWIVESLSKRTPITVFDDVWFSPLSMRRLAEYIVLVIERRQPGVFNLGSRNGMSKADFAFALAETMQLPTSDMSRGSANQSNFDAYRPKDMRTDSGRFAHVFGIELPTLLEEIRTMRIAYGQ